MRLGINSIIALSNSIKNRPFEKLQLADNAITDHGMYAVKNIIKDSSKLISLNLASNMISGEGLELLLDDLITNTSIKNLDLGVVESSMRKNSLGIQGAVCIAALLIRNETLRVLKISENDLKSEGAIPIINSSVNLETLNLAKNGLKSDVGKPLEKLLKKSRMLKKLNLEYNELMVHGTKALA